MLTRVNKPVNKTASLLFSAISSSLLLAVGLTTLSSAQAAVSLNEDSIVSTSTIASHCNNDTSHVEAKFWQNKYQSARQRAIACMQLELKAYQRASMSDRQQYFAYKAQAWLNYANHEDSIKSRTAAGDYALKDAESILQALKNNTEDDLNLITDIPQTSALMRPDLWANISALKDSGGIASSPRELAFGEVGLIWASADQCEHGWRSSSPNFRMANRWLEQAREAFVNANEAAASVAMQDLAVSYYEQYKSLDSGNDICRGQVLSSNIQTPLVLSITDIAIVDIIAVAGAIPSAKPTVSYDIAQ